MGEGWGVLNLRPRARLPARAPGGSWPRECSRKPLFTAENDTRSWKVASMSRFAAAAGYCRYVARAYGGQAAQSGSLFDEAEEQAAAAAAPLPGRGRPPRPGDGV